MGREPGQTGSPLRAPGRRPRPENRRLRGGGLFAQHAWEPRGPGQPGVGWAAGRAGRPERRQLRILLVARAPLAKPERTGGGRRGRRGDPFLCHHCILRERPAGPPGGAELGLASGSRFLRKEEKKWPRLPAPENPASARGLHCLSCAGSWWCVCGGVVLEEGEEDLKGSP